MDLEAQGRDSTFTFCHAHLKKAILFLKMAKSPVFFLQGAVSSVVLDWDWPNVLASYSKSNDATIKISIVLERGRLHQFIEVIRWDLGPLKVVFDLIRS